MFENLTERIEGALKTLKGESKITEINIAASVKEIRRALVDADVNYKVAKEFTDKIKDKALGEKVFTAVSPGQLMVKIVKDELTELMGGSAVDINLTGTPSVVLVAGLQGSGKTTFSAKLANYLKTKKGSRILLVACDIYRPAAIEQLKVLGEQIGVEVYSEPENKNAVQIATNAIQHAKATGVNTVIIDTAGRLAIDEQMMQEIENVKKNTKPHETLFVVDAMTGQDAVNTARTFNERLNFDGVVLTKLDGDTRGGAALSIKYEVKKPIKFVGTGEKMDALDVFHPDRMAQRILGMGDIVSFVEKAQEQFDAEQAAKLQKKIRREQFDFDDFLSQLNQIRKMGNIKDLMGMIPGMSKMAKDIDIDDDSFKKVEAIILSMTPQERATPELLSGNRRKRIADGSGNSISDVNKFVKQFDEMRKMMKTMTKMTSSGRALPKMPFMGK
ncbi:MAG: signal recognition particle protein [Chitinophagales bacterium]|mgnify:CR=1 FL=1|nr:signal recognition particle protein [Chitinophagales bacterium]